MYTPFYDPMFSASARLANPDWDKMADCVYVDTLVRMHAKDKEIEELKFYTRFMSEK